MTCCGDCLQGRRQCQCPEACEMPIQFVGREPRRIDPAVAGQWFFGLLAVVCLAVWAMAMLGWLA